MPTPLADIKAHTGADKRPASCCLRSTPTPRKMGDAFVATPQSHSLDKSAAEWTPCGRRCLATASLIHSAPPLRYRLHTSGRRTAPTSPTIQGLYGTRISRHNDTSTQAPPHTPSAARRQTTPLRLPWRSLMQCRAIIPHQSKPLTVQQPTAGAEALMAEFFGWAALLSLSSSPRCPGHLRLARCRCCHRHACHDITPTCFRDMKWCSREWTGPDITGVWRGNMNRCDTPLCFRGVCNASVPRSTRTQPPIHQLGHIIGISPPVGWCYPFPPCFSIGIALLWVS